jgi:hypothetical protein
VIHLVSTIALPLRLSDACFFLVCLEIRGGTRKLQNSGMDCNPPLYNALAETGIFGGNLQSLLCCLTFQIVCFELMEYFGPI